MLELSKMPALGFQTKHICVDCQSQSKIAHNVRKIVGYLPGLSLIQGIEHIVTAVKDRKHVSHHFIWRGVMEILGLGFLLLIPDLIVTCLREQKAKVNDLQSHKIAPIVITKPTPIPEPVSFTAQVSAFVEKTERKYSPLLDILEAKIKRKACLGKYAKLRHMLDMCLVDYSAPANKEKVKQIIFDLAKSSDSALCIVLGYMRDKQVFTDAPKDIAFYTEIGLCSNQPSYMVWLDLDLSLSHCLEAVRTLGLQAVKSDSTRMLSYLQQIGLKNTIPEHKAVRLELLEACARQNPYYTLENLESLQLTPTEAANLSVLCNQASAGDLAAKKAHAWSLFADAPSIFMNNLPYFKFSTGIPKEREFLKEIAVRCLVKDSYRTLKSFELFGFDMQKDRADLADILLETAGHKHYPFSAFEELGFVISTSDGLELMRKIALKQVRLHAELVVHKFSKYYLDKGVKAHQPILQEIAFAGIEDDAEAILNSSQLFGIVCGTPEYNQLCKAALMLDQGSLEERKQKARKHLSSFADNAKYYFDRTKPEELEVLKELVIERISGCTIEHLKKYQFELEDVKDILMRMAKQGSGHKMVFEMWKWKNLFGFNSDSDKTFFRDIALTISCYDPSIVKAMTWFGIHASHQEDFAPLKEIALRVAKQSGSKIKRTIQDLGFDPSLPDHKAALDEIMQAAILEDGPDNLEGFGVHNLSAKKADLYAFMSGPVLKSAKLGKLKDVLEPLFKQVVNLLNDPDGKEDLKKMACEIASYPDQAVEFLDYMLANDILRMHRPGEYWMVEEIAVAIASHDHKFNIFNKLINKFALPHNLLTSISMTYARSYSFSIKDWVNKVNLSKKSVKLIAKEAVKYTPEQTLSFMPSVGPAMKTGTEEERLAEAKVEAKENLPGLLKNLSYYNLNTESLTELSELLLHLDPFTILLTPERDIKITQKNLLSIAEKEPAKIANALHTIFLKLCKKDDAWRLQLALTLAKKDSKTLGDNFSAFNWDWGYTQQKRNIETVISAAFEENQKGTLLHLDQFGVPDGQQAKLTASLVNHFLVQNTIPEKIAKFREAIKRSPINAMENLEYYFDETIPEEKKAIAAVAVDLLKATGDLAYLARLGFKPDENQAILLKAAEGTDAAPGLFDLKTLKNSLHITIQDNFGLIEKLALCVTKNHPHQVLKQVLESQLDLKHQEHCNLVFQVYMLAAQQDSFLLMKEFALPFELYDPLQYKAAEQILLSMAKETGETCVYKMGIKKTTYYADKIKRTLVKLKS